MSAHHHRATLKQSNKSFKSKHASKGSLKAASKGASSILTTPIPLTPGKPASSAAAKPHKSVSSSNKKNRLHANAQKRENKRKSVQLDNKFFSTSSGGSAVPRIISVVPLLPSLSPRRFLAGLLPTLGLPESEVAAGLEGVGEVGTYMIRAPRFKTNLQVNLLPALSTYDTLDAALVSDYVVLLLSSTDEVQLEGEAVLRCLQGQVGGVDIVACVQAPEDKPIVPSTKNLIHKSLLSFTKYFFPAVPKIHSTDTPAEAALFARAVCEAAPGGTREDTRAYMLAEGSSGVRWTPTTSEDQGTLEIIGTVRGGALSANRLVHVPGHGDYQVQAVLPAPPSALAIAAKPHHAAMATDETNEPLSVPGENADDLTATNIPDTMANEQTWPTEEELAEGESRGGPSEPKRTKRVPKGTSAYQAAWIVDDDDEEDDDDEDDDEMDEDGDLDDGEDLDGVDEDDEEETEEIELDSKRGETHRDLDPEQEEREYTEYLKEREKAAEQDQRFPDEIDTPRHILARTRFQRYRGLKSFRTSPWDPYENLPLDYGRIFQFENFGATGRRIEREAREDGVKAGTRVILVLKDVPRSVMDRDERLPFIVHGLLQHEHKQSVLHFLVQRNTEYDEPIKAKDPLILCVGPRRYTVRPLFSQHVRGGGKGVNNVHKSEKFLRAGSATVLTTFGPVSFGKSPCIVLRGNPAQPSLPHLVAMGSSLPPDPTRIISKRIVLSGHPLKIHKKTATIRYMFFDREDVEYFRTVELHTKYGRIGHISEPLGTHGYFKAHFDGPIGQMDTICMSLYKRQFPKWAETFKPDARVEAVEGEAEEVMDLE